MGKRVVFVSHDASRTGAPLMLLHFLRWLRDNSDLDFSVTLRRGGELVGDFAEVATVTTVSADPPGAGRALRMVRRVGWADQALDPLPVDLNPAARVVRPPARRAALRDLQRRAFGVHPPDLIYLNTAASGSVLSLAPEATPVISHVHELGYMLRYLRDREPRGIEQMLARTRHYIAAAHAAAEVLVDEFDVDPARITVCHEFIPIDDRPLEPRMIDRARAELGIAPETYVVGSVGTVGWRKGADLFIQLAKRTLELLGGSLDVVFLWLGAADERVWEERVRHDLDNLGLRDQVRFLGARPDPRPIVELFDAFVLMSRSDTYPLAFLEAAAQGKPTLCFPAGGMTEFLEPADDLLIPYLDVDAMARRIVGLLRSDAERTRLGQQLAQRVKERHRLEVVAPNLLAEIERVLGARDSAARLIEEPVR